MNTNAQTPTTTTITGSLKVNDSLNVSNNIQAADIISRGEMIAQSNLKTDSDLLVTGNADISGNLKVGGISKLSGGVLSPSITLGTATANISISMQTLSTGARILGFGFAGPVIELPSTCIQPYNSSMSIFNARAGIFHSSSANMLDFNNDGSNGYIDYGYDISIFANQSGVTIPALKINSHCYGDVEIAKGGGFVSTGSNMEVGNPVRNGGIAQNINAPNKIGQRVHVTQTLPDTYNPFPDCYNTQLFVNRSKIKALAVINTATNSNGDQTFVVYGSGKTHIGVGRPLASGPITNAMLTVDGLVVAKEVKVTVSSAYWADYVFETDYKLMPLTELRSFIQKYKHLPNVPSTEDITTNGNDLGRTDAVLLAKIEECMLYIMELDKKVTELQKENDVLKAKTKNSN